jgi:hypothetical protein
MRVRSGGRRPKELEGCSQLPVGCSAQGPIAVQSVVDEFGLSFCFAVCTAAGTALLSFRSKGGKG